MANPIRDLINVTPGTARADSPLVVDANKRVDLDMSTIKIDGTEVTATASELNALDGILATVAELNRVADLSTRIVDITAATDALTVVEHADKVVTLNRAGGIDLTLPEATGSGARFMLLVKTTVTDDYIVTASGCCDTMVGSAIVHQDCANSVLSFDAGPCDNVFTMNGDTTGGVAGSWVEFTDIATNTWFVRASLIATGCESTPFGT